ncbi:MAG TPA: ribose-5-phosphate isomerase RpiA [Acidobacteriota bacterium]|nr:ribose-5-phosphate isomerase RpiA [Acidobacteriota bacterium]
MSERVSLQDQEKKAAAEAALSYVREGMSLGLGTGSTAAFAVRGLGRMVRDGLKIRAVPTSRQTRSLARAEGIPLTTLQDCPRLDLTIDGADEADRRCRLVKGGGGALLREKIVASASRRMLAIVDSSKLVEYLGAFPLPVEVVPFAWPVVLPRLAALGCSPVLRRRGDEPFVTDEGNYIIDCPFKTLDDPSGLAAEISPLAGVVEHGLFIGLCHEVIVARGSSTETISCGPGNEP